MTREAKSITDQLASLLVEERDALDAYETLARETADSTSHLVLEILTRETKDDLALLGQVAGGAPALEPRCASDPCDDRRFASGARGAARAAHTRAQRLRDLACSERGLERERLALLLEALAMNTDKHAHLLAQLAYCIELMTSAPPFLTATND